MTTEVTLQLPEKVYRHATRLAQLTNQDVTHVLEDTLELALPSGPSIEELRPVANLSDEEVLIVADSMMDEQQGQQMSELLDRQQRVGCLTALERIELASLLQVYQEGLLRKAQGLAEAVRRGLRERLDP